MPFVADLLHRLRGVRVESPDATRPPAEETAPQEIPPERPPGPAGRPAGVLPLSSQALDRSATLPLSACHSQGAGLRWSFGRRWVIS